MDECTYCGTGIPDHGPDCAHHLRVELDAARARVAKLEADNKRLRERGQALVEAWDVDEEVYARWEEFCAALDAS